MFLSGALYFGELYQFILELQLLQRFAISMRLAVLKKRVQPQVYLSHGLLIYVSLARNVSRRVKT
jgi:hypothetical protein